MSKGMSFLDCFKIIGSHVELLLKLFDLPTAKILKEIREIKKLIKVSNVYDIGIQEEMPFGELFARAHEKSVCEFMGHALYTFFVEDEENFKDKLIKLLGNGMTLKILLLNPKKITEQVCEVENAQQIDPNEWIELPSGGKEPRYLRIDIELTLRALHEIWCNLKEKDNIEVRVTSRTMYISFNRIDDRMIVTHYTDHGLARKSPSLYIDKTMEFFEIYVREYENMRCDKVKTKKVTFLEKGEPPWIFENIT